MNEVNNNPPVNITTNITSVDHLWSIVKYVGASIVTLSAVYGVAWGMGLGIMTNGQTERMITAAILANNTQVFNRISQSDQFHNNNHNTMLSNFSNLKDTVTRLDERTIDIQNELKSQRFQMNQLQRQPFTLPSK